MMGDFPYSSQQESYGCYQPAPPITNEMPLTNTMSPTYSTHPFYNSQPSAINGDPFNPPNYPGSAPQNYTGVPTKPEPYWDSNPSAQPSPQTWNGQNANNASMNHWGTTGGPHFNHLSSMQMGNPSQMLPNPSMGNHSSYQCDVKLEPHGSRISPHRDYPREPWPYLSMLPPPPASLNPPIGFSSNADSPPVAVAERFLEIEQRLSWQLKSLSFGDKVSHVYNPLEYAIEPHTNFVKKFCDSRKDILFLGMNPGPFGMAQTGVPFGEAEIVRDWLDIKGDVRKPDKEHPKRPVWGLSCPRKEVSGTRLWGFIKKVSHEPEHFFHRAFVHNMCPLIFLAPTGRNLTPPDLPVAFRRPLNDICDHALCEVVSLLGVSVVVGIGKYAQERAMTALEKGGVLGVRVHSIMHPSPANPAANKGWEDTVERQLIEMDVLRYIMAPKHPAMVGRSQDIPSNQPTQYQQLPAREENSQQNPTEKLQQTHQGNTQRNSVDGLQQQNSLVCSPQRPFVNSQVNQMVNLPPNPVTNSQHSSEQNSQQTPSSSVDSPHGAPQNAVASAQLASGPAVEQTAMSASPQNLPSQGNTSQETLESSQNNTVMSSQEHAQQNPNSAQQNPDSPPQNVNSPQQTPQSSPQNLKSPQPNSQSPQQILQESQQNITTPQPHPNAPQPHPNTPQPHPNTPQPHPNVPQQPNAPHQHPNAPQQQPNPPHQHPNAPQQHPNALQPHPNAPQQHPNSPQPHLNAHQQHPNAPPQHSNAPPHPNAPQQLPNSPHPHPNAPQPHPNAPQHHLNAPQPHSNAPRPHPNAPQPHLNAPKPHPNAAQPHPNAPQPHPNAPPTHPNVPQQLPNAPQPHPNAPQPHPNAPQPLPNVPQQYPNGLPQNPYVSPHNFHGHPQNPYGHPPDMHMYSQQHYMHRIPTPPQNHGFPQHYPMTNSPQQNPYRPPQNPNPNLQNSHVMAQNTLSSKQNPHAMAQNHLPNDQNPHGMRQNPIPNQHNPNMPQNPNSFSQYPMVDSPLSNLANFSKNLHSSPQPPHASPQHSHASPQHSHASPQNPHASPHPHASPQHPHAVSQHYPVGTPPLNSQQPNPANSNTQR